MEETLGMKGRKYMAPFDRKAQYSMEYIPKVLQAVAGEDFTIYLYFSDGSVRLYDAIARVHVTAHIPCCRVIQHRQPVTEIIRVAHRLEHSPQLQQGLCIIQADRAITEIKHNGTAQVHHRICAVP